MEEKPKAITTSSISTSEILSSAMADWMTSILITECLTSVDFKINASVRESFIKSSSLKCCVYGEELVLDDPWSSEELWSLFF